MKRHRSLTEGEIKLAQGIFGDSIDYSKIKVFSHKYSRLLPDNFNAAPDGNLYMVKNSTDDYSKSPVADQAALLHELTHVWQIQNKTENLEAGFLKETLKAKFNYRATNNYKLETGKEFTAYGFEQQAGIVEDYVRVSAGEKALYNKGAAATPEEYKATLAKLLENPTYATHKTKPGFFRGLRR